MGVVEDDEDFAAFVAARGPILLRTATLLCGDPHEGEDLLQGALERCYPRWGRLRRSGSPEGYVRRALVNSVINRRIRGQVVREQVGADVVDQSADDRDHAVTIADRDVVLRALRALPVRQRTVLVLRFFDDLTESEVARLMGSSPGTVKSQTSRALAKLREDPVLRLALDRPAVCRD